MLNRDYLAGAGAGLFAASVCVFLNLGTRDLWWVYLLCALVPTVVWMVREF